jgi:hypothetical protein
MCKCQQQVQPPAAQHTAQQGPAETLWRDALMSVCLLRCPHLMHAACLIPRSCRLRAVLRYVLCAV